LSYSPAFFHCTLSSVANLSAARNHFNNLRQCRRKHPERIRPAGTAGGHV